jgi:glycosyltransferase involved in cell wall biosynthesis
MRTAKRIMLIGKSSVKDYVGARTQYLFNALTEAGLNVIVYDIDSSEDIPPNISVSIFLQWLQLFDEGWARFLKTISGRKILYTENWWWYDEMRAKFLRDNNLDLEDIFNSVAFSTNENNRWWPRGRCDFWGVCVDEDMAFPKKTGDYIYVDEIWPKEWSEGIYTASEVLNQAIPIIKDKYGLKVISQASKNGSEAGPISPRAEWVDEWIEPYSDINDMLGVLGGAKAYFTSHEETLGLIQFEAMMCGVPIITSPTFSKNEVYEGGEGLAIFSWDWEKKKDDDGNEVVVKNVAKAAEEMIVAFENSLKETNREEIRKQAVARFGKKAFVEKSGLTSLLS